MRSSSRQFDSHPPIFQQAFAHLPVIVSSPNYPQHFPFQRSSCTACPFVANTLTLRDLSGGQFFFPAFDTHPLPKSPHTYHLLKRRLILFQTISHLAQSIQPFSSYRDSNLLFPPTFTSHFSPHTDPNSRLSFPRQQSVDSSFQRQQQRSNRTINNQDIIV